MSASWPDNMRGPRVKTPLLLLLLLLTTLTGTVLCQDEEEITETESPEVEATEEQPSEAPPTSIPPSPDGSEVIVDENSDGEGSADSDNPGISDYIPGHELSLTNDILTDDTSTTSTPIDEEGLSPIIIMIPVVLVVVIIAIIVVCIFIKRRWNKKVENQDLRKEDPYLEDASAEKVPMPMFEEDVPSVLELEMEELDQWMKKDGETAGDSKQA
ncbi:transmembrane protein 154 isoform X1 [Thunnus albacares]|uniref:transmembrane protein 154 isoform X1 n=1 Tax=Thunnus albacares TaxID=8236 RepID=UPI001CF63816|nr:transmembrane protein 154 isoform X1 [Thunnus albacares]